MTTPIPQHVLDTAARIANDPVKYAAYQSVVNNLPKLATLSTNLFGGAEITGTQKVLGTIAGGVGAALLGVAGTSIYNKLTALTSGKGLLTHQEEDKELGKLNARATFAAGRAILLTKHHDTVLADLMKSDSIIKEAPKSLVLSSFKTMAKFAPNLAADENAARSFLRTSIESGSGPSFATLQILADAEKSVQQAGGISFGGK